MEENTDQPIESQTTELPHAPEPDITLGDAMAGTFSEPGDTFSAVKQANKNYWLIPLLIVVIVSILSSFLVMRDEELSSEIKDKQKKAMNEQFDKAVKEGKMTREQADQQLEQSQKFMGGGMMMVFGIIGSLFAVVLFFFIKALIYWGVLKGFKGTATFKDVMNVLGLTGLITAVQLVVDTALAIMLGKLTANIGPALLFTQETVGNSVFKLLGHFDLLMIWYLIVVGIGLAKVSNLSTYKTTAMVFVLWLIWVGITSFSSIGTFVGR
jgi:Yip1 domain